MEGCTNVIVGIERRVRAAPRGSTISRPKTIRFLRAGANRAETRSAMDSLHVFDHASETGSWRIASRAPTGALAPYAVAFNAYDERNTSFRRRRELPDGLAVLIFNLGEELRVEHPVGAMRAFGEGEGIYSGASATYVITETNGAQTGAQIKFSLLGARLFLGRPLGELAEALIDPLDVMGRSAAELRDRLAETRTQEERVELLTLTVERRLGQPERLAEELVFAFARLSRADIRIADLACKVGMSREHFSKAFRREFGLAPKTFARVRRFTRALRRREREPWLGWAELAPACGYVDQAHMTRDFREFAGSPPAALGRRGLPDGGGFMD
jgi:AraC-like DNA-binding protein